MIITAYNPSTDNLEKTYLASAYPAGTTSILVRNNQGFANTNLIMIGEMGREKTEIVAITGAVTLGTAITIGATKYPHSADDPVYLLKYDQIKFYRSTTGSGGSYSILATVAMDVDNAERATLYDDVAGLTTYYYKVTFYNSVGAIESGFSDPMAGTGYSRLQIGSLVNEFLTEVDDLQQNYITVPQVLGLLNECNDDLSTQSRRPYRFLRTSVPLDITAATSRITLPISNILKVDRLKYTYNLLGTNRTDNIDLISIQEMEYLKYDNLMLTSDEMFKAAIDETTNELVLYPTPTTTQLASLRLYYWKNFTTIDSLGDTLETPTPRIYKLFLMGRFFRKRAVKEDAFLKQSDRYINDYNAEIVKMQRANKLDIGTPTGFKPDTRNSRGLRKY